MRFPVRPALLASALVSLAAPLALADVIPDGVTSVDHEIRIELAREYPGTTFVVFPTEGDAPWSRRGREGEAGKRGVAVITSATPRLELSKFAESPQLWAVRDPLPTNREEVTAEWLSAHATLTSPHAFVQLRYVDEDEGVKRIRTVYRVEDGPDGRPHLVGVSEERLAQDGTVKARRVPPVGEDRRGGHLDRPAREPRTTGLAMATDPGRMPALALSIAGAAFAVLVLRRRSALAA